MVALRQMKNEVPTRRNPDIFNAAVNNDIDEMVDAIEFGQRLDDKDEIGNFTPIHIAILRESMEFLAVALQKNFDPWVRDLNDRLAFDHASALGMKDIQKKLYEKMYPAGWQFQGRDVSLEP